MAKQYLRQPVLSYCTVNPEEDLLATKLIKKVGSQTFIDDLAGVFLVFMPEHTFLNEDVAKQVLVNDFSAHSIRIVLRKKVFVLKKKKKRTLIPSIINDKNTENITLDAWIKELITVLSNISSHETFAKKVLKALEAL
jgi:hypothetical protein